MHPRSGRSRAKSAGSPPTMMLSVPSRAACAVRAIGASAKAAPRAPKAWWSSRASATGQVLMSTTVWPEATRAARPPSAPAPRQTARTWGSPGRHRNTISARRATSAAEPAACTPSAASAASGAGRSSKATTVAPDFLARFRHIGSPMTPSPTNPSTPAVAMPASTCPDFSCTRGTRESPRTALPAWSTGRSDLVVDRQCAGGGLLHLSVSLVSRQGHPGRRRILGRRQLGPVPAAADGLHQQHAAVHPTSQDVDVVPLVHEAALWCFLSALAVDARLGPRPLQAACVQDAFV